MTLPIIIVVIFLIMAGLMISRKLSVVWALPLTAVAIAIAAGVGFQEILTEVIEGGAYRLNGPIIIVMFGGILAQQVKETGIAETIVRYAAELAGDKPLAVAVILGVITMLLFTVLGGLGAIIMVGSIVLPVMVSVGITPLVAGCLFLIGISFGGIFNLANWSLYIDTFKLSQSQVLSFALPLFGLALAVFVIFAWIQTRHRARGWAAAAAARSRGKGVTNKWLLGPIALITPLVPILLTFPFAGYQLYLKFTHADPELIKKAFTFPFIPAFSAAVIFGFIATYPRKEAKGLLPWNWFSGRKGSESSPGNAMMKAVFEGVKSVAPAVVLMIGVGMLLKATMHPNVVASMGKILPKIVPATAILYVIVFGVLAPLSLYRGPLNLWGMGLGVGELMVQTRSLGALTAMGMLLSVGQIQGACDPTNTHNVWVASFLKIDVNDILKKTLPWIWALAFLGLIVSAAMFMRV